jgi:cell wall-associated NlpC family hydrolase
MANFFDAVTEASITSIRIRKGTKFRIGLYGGGPPPDFARLNVTTDPGAGESLKTPDPAVTFVTEIRSWNFIYEIDADKIKSTRVRACYNGSDYSAPVQVSTTQDIRASIVKMARSFVSTAHYLWGTAGNEPGSANGNVGGGKISAATLRDASLDPKETTRDKVLAACTAAQPLFDGYNTCAGRSGRYSETPDLETFLKVRQEDINKGKTDQTNWEGAGSHKKLFPRKYYFRGALQKNGVVIWGESCVGVRHFDCVGLVNYCYAKHWYQAVFGMDIAAFRNSSCGTIQVTNDQDLMDADILIKPGNNHIGMLYQVSNNWFVVQAVGTETGVTDTEPFTAKAWDRYRMQDAFLVPRK